MSKIVHSLEPITLVGGGDAPAEMILEALGHGPRCVAADGGANQALAAGVQPEAVIGDLDSVSEDTRAHLPAQAFHQISEQDSTDFDKALRSIEAPLVLGVGFCGARLDHQLAALHTLARHPERRCILLGREEVITLCPRQLNLPMIRGQTVSLVPLAPVEARSEGLHWPLNTTPLSPIDRIGTSNLSTGPVRLTVDSPHLLLILPRPSLGGLVEALRSSPSAARWPARA